MIFDSGSTVSDLVRGRTVEQLLEDSRACSNKVTDESNPYRDKGYRSYSKELRFYIEVIEAGMGDYTVMVNNGRWKVFDKYWFFSQSGKWSVVGKSVVYKSKGFPDFVERFLSKDYNYQKLVNKK
jgi:hypothetical protein